MGFRTFVSQHRDLQEQRLKRARAPFGHFIHLLTKTHWLIISGLLSPINYKRFQTFTGKKRLCWEQTFLCDFNLVLTFWEKASETASSAFFLSTSWHLAYNAATNSDLNKMPAHYLPESECATLTAFHPGLMCLLFWWLHHSVCWIAQSTAPALLLAFTWCGPEIISSSYKHAVQHIENKSRE